MIFFLCWDRWVTQSSQGISGGNFRSSMVDLTTKLGFFCSLSILNAFLTHDIFSLYWVYQARSIVSWKAPTYWDIVIKIFKKPNLSHNNTCAPIGVWTACLRRTIIQGHDGHSWEFEITSNQQWAKIKCSVCLWVNLLHTAACCCAWSQSVEMLQAVRPCANEACTSHTVSWAS